MDFLRFLKTRHSVYDFDKTRVSVRDLRRILEAGRWSPSCHNTQPWKFIVVKDRKRILRLVDCCTSAAFAIPPPQLIAVVLDKTCVDISNVCAPNVEHGLLDAHVCCGTAAMSMALMAHALRIDTGFLTPNPVIADKLLEVPKKRKTVLLILLGKERKGAFRKPKTRKSMKDIVCKERYHA